MKEVSVLISGGGSVGLSLAAELGWRNIDCMLVEQASGLNNHPRANAVANRTMEYYRRWGIDKAITEAGIPPDHPADYYWLSSLHGRQLHRISLPPFKKIREVKDTGGYVKEEHTWSPYLKTITGQNEVEETILNYIDTLLERYKGCSIGWSTHEDQNEIAPIQIAVAKGATMFERHVGLDTDEVKLNSYSSRPKQLDKWFEAFRYSEILCGSKTDRPITKIEKDSLDGLQRGMFAKKDICLLHGVTSSGKTEMYIKLIEQEIKKGKQVLYLLPEIALTIQIIKRLKNHFGNLVGVSHSNLNNSERVEVWKSVQAGAKNKFSIILGARSSVFLPFNNLGLIIIDEEHDSSYKQQQPAPRYHARDSAIYLASLHNAKVLLGSATPSIETYYNAKNKKYGFVELLTRFSDIKLPKINAIDVKKGYLKKDMDGFFSNRLIDEIKSHLDNNKQIILFQ